MNCHPLQGAHAPSANGTPSQPRVMEAISFNSVLSEQRWDKPRQDRWMHGSHDVGVSSYCTLTCSTSLSLVSVLELDNFTQPFLCAPAVLPRTNKTVMIMFLGSIPAGVLEFYLVVFYTVRFHVILWIT